MRKRKRILSILIVLSLFVGMVGLVNVDPAYAASRKTHLRKTTITVTAGKTYQQKLINKNGKTISATKVRWKSLKTSVATINKKGKITTLRAGSAKMTAKYNGKTYRFTVTVKKPFTSSSKPWIDYIGAEGTSIDVEWLKLKNAVKYQVYVSTNGGSYKLYATTSASHKTINNVVPGKKYSIKVRGVAGKYYSAYSTVETVKVPIPRYIKLEQSSYNIAVGETVVVNALTNDGATTGYTISDWSCVDVLSRETGTNENGEHYEHVTLKGLKAGTVKMTFSVGDPVQVRKTVTINITSTPEQARAELRNYILKNGKEVTSGSGLIGDYYIESRAYASSSYNRTVISAYLKSNTLVFESIDNNDARFTMIHNQPDVPAGTDNFDYYTNQKPSGSLFPISYWGDIAMSKYAAKLYGEEEGISNCMKSGPATVTDTTELYKIYRKASDSMKDFDSFMKSKVGFGLKAIGYNNM